MNLHGFKLRIFLVVFLVVLLGGLGLKYWHYRAGVLQPLREELGRLQGVEQVELQRIKAADGNKTLLKLRPEGGADLPGLLRELRFVLEGQRGNFVLELTDSASPHLLEAFTRVQIAAEEAIMTGEFVLLESRLGAWALEQNIDWKLAVDRDYLYIELAAEHSTLWRVLSRGSAPDQLRILTEGGLYDG